MRPVLWSSNSWQDLTRIAPSLSHVKSSEWILPWEAVEDKDGSDFAMANKPLGLGPHGERTGGESWPASNNLQKSQQEQNLHQEKTTNTTNDEMFNQKCLMVTEGMICSSDRQSPRVSEVCITCHKLEDHKTGQVIFDLCVHRIQVHWKEGRSVWGCVEVEWPICLPLSRSGVPRWEQSVRPRVWELLGRSSCHNSCRISISLGTAVGRPSCPPLMFANTLNKFCVYPPVIYSAHCESAIQGKPQGLSAASFTSDSKWLESLCLQ